MTVTLQDPAHVHAWELRSEDYEDFQTVRVFECFGCEAVEVR